MSLSLALIGYGEAGRLFAREFVRAGAKVAVYDVKPLSVEEGVRRAENPAAAIEGAEIVCAAQVEVSSVATARSPLPRSTMADSAARGTSVDGR